MHESHANDHDTRDQTSPSARGSSAPSDDLTCSEGQVEDLLSKGESTGDARRPRKGTTQKGSPPGSPPLNVPDRKRG